jgi:predicted  nucleic acid-binding Zn-ribbon protein
MGESQYQYAGQGLHDQQLLREVVALAESERECDRLRNLVAEAEKQRDAARAKLAALKQYVSEQCDKWSPKLDEATRRANKLADEAGDLRASLQAANARIGELDRELQRERRKRGG